MDEVWIVLEMEEGGDLIEICPTHFAKKDRAMQFCRKAIDRRIEWWKEFYDDFKQNSDGIVFEKVDEEDQVVLRMSVDYGGSFFAERIFRAMRLEKEEGDE